MYKYEDYRPFLFSEEGQVVFLKKRDIIKDMLNKSKYVDLEDIVRNTSGSNFETIACVDRMLELNEIVEMTDKNSVKISNFRIFRKSF